ncbi:uncharacterized protein LOC114180632 [Vigna unguiculata]|uniref:uncharacterized protein LOC114180632 n=1 Tax=Vigna unguiculata TaxID=3917 RepID=UPI001015C9F0|nr:uncharacterized protein LOC114180632 [Vigna unguiculata]
METIRLLFSLAAQHGWRIQQMDVKSAFLNGILEEEAPRAWNERIDTYFKKNGYEQCPYEYALYLKRYKGDVLFVALYVDDLIFMGSKVELVEEFKEVMKKEFEMTDLGIMKYFLGLEVDQSTTGIFVSQKRYAEELLMKAKMSKCNPVSTPMEPGTKLSKNGEGDKVDATRYRSLVGSLRYLTNTRPNLMLSVGITSRFMEEPRYSHWKALKRILRYVKGTMSFGLLFTKSDNYRLTGYSDSDWCGDMDDRKSTAGYVFFMGNTTFT